MQKVIKYSVFQTKWGYFGLAGTELSLHRTHLPGREREKIRCRLVQNLTGLQYDKNYFKFLQEQIAAYFEGCCVDFDPCMPVSIDHLSQFSRKVLSTCRNIEFGRTVTYSRLAKASGRPAAGRAVGNALAKNPLPLIIPCHRVIRIDGGIGGFTAQGGIDLKIRLLEHEH
jgi:O-6-methylguanine DNA methyltransferase